MKKFAILIDADNTAPNAIEPVLEEIAKYGIASVKRIYGDWSIENLQSWRSKLLPNAITPVQQFAYVKQKDATDMKLVIDAMDLLYAKDLDGFCIVSSDSDFTPLAARIRESGLTVYGFGKNNTVSSFINACDRFFYIENLMAEPIALIKTDNSDPKKTQSVISTKKELDPQTMHLIYKAIKDNANDDGWASLGGVGSYINTVKPDFDTRTYGHSKLSNFMNALSMFDVKNIGQAVYVKKFSYSQFINCIKNILNKNANAHDWMTVKSIADLLYQQRTTNRLENYNQTDILQKIDAINSPLIEFNDNRTKIRLSIVDD